MILNFTVRTNDLTNIHKKPCDYFLSCGWLKIIRRSFSDFIEQNICSLIQVTNSTQIKYCFPISFTVYGKKYFEGDSTKCIHSNIRKKSQHFWSWENIESHDCITRYEQFSTILFLLRNSRFLASPTLSAAIFSAANSCWIPWLWLVILR